MPTLNRRETLLGLSGLTCARVLPASAAAPEDWAAQFARDLQAMARPGTLLRLRDFGIDDTAARISAVIEMTWQPGLCRRRLVATGGTAGTAYDRLRGQVVTTFGTLNSQGIDQGTV